MGACAATERASLLVCVGGGGGGEPALPCCCSGNNASIGPCLSLFLVGSFPPQQQALSSTVPCMQGGIARQAQQPGKRLWRAGSVWRIEYRAHRPLEGGGGVRCCAGTGCRVGCSGIAAVGNECTNCCCSCGTTAGAACVALGVSLQVSVGVEAVTASAVSRKSRLIGYRRAEHSRMQQH